MKLGKNELLELHRALRLTRTLEDWISYICTNQNPNNPLIIGKGYLSTGQEAVSVGAGYTLNPCDWVAQSHRDFGLLLMQGMTIEELLKQYFSKADSPTHGRDANVHFGDTKRHLLGFISHMGAMLPAANGVAWALRYQKKEGVVLAFFGDGASSQGAVHEAMNYAAVFKLPVVFICNNNRWAISTPIHEQFAIENIADRASAYGMPGAVCDGNKVLDVYQTVKVAVDRAREGQGPSLIECKTMRMAGHGTHDRAKYVPDAEFNEWKKRDPILQFEAHLKDLGVADDAYFEEVAKKLKAIVEAASEKVRHLEGPKPEGQLEDVFAS